LYLENVEETGNYMFLIELQSDVCSRWFTQENWPCLVHHH